MSEPSRVQLRALLDEARSQSARTGQETLAAWTTDVGPIDFDRCLAVAEVRSDRVFCWRSSWSELSLVAIGSSWELVPVGPDRFSLVRDAWQTATERLISGNDSSGSGNDSPKFPFLVGGFAFSAAEQSAPTMPDALLWCPEATLLRDASGSTFLCLTALVSADTDTDELAGGLIVHARDWMQAGSDQRPGPGIAGHSPAGAQDAAPVDRGGGPQLISRLEQPDLPHWRHLVSDALAEFARGAMHKAVLAREVILQADRPFEVPAAIQTLSTHYDQGSVFAARMDDQWFIGATPECLVRVTDGTITAHSIAGTAPRGLDTVTDDGNAHRLANSVKNVHEQGLVTEYIAETLHKSCERVEVGAEPEVMRLANVQHLFTTITAYADRANLFELAESLHPTPAVGGYPRDDAMAWITAAEPFARGWYAAPIGWCDTSGEGELAVAIRSALVSGNTATLYAGVGLVEGSEPDEEFRETELKLRPMLTALGVTD